MVVTIKNNYEQAFKKGNYQSFWLGSLKKQDI